MARVNKLVRDDIPAIIRSSGRRPVTRTLSDEEYREQLEKKLQEEVIEYITDKNGEELADIIEVVYALGSTLGLSPYDLEVLRQGKETKNGAFKKRIFLIDIEE